MTPQNNTWQTKLREDFHNDYCMKDPATNGIEMGLKLVNSVDWWIERIQQELQRALQECLPERKNYVEHPGDTTEDEEYIDGWLDCREQFIKNAKSRGIIIE